MILVGTLTRVQGDNRCKVLAALSPVIFVGTLTVVQGDIRCKVLVALSR